jgi:hypothetical protein
MTEVAEELQSEFGLVVEFELGAASVFDIVIVAAVELCPFSCQ